MFNLLRRVLKNSKIKRWIEVGTAREKWLKRILCIIRGGYYHLREDKNQNDNTKMNIAKYIKLLQYTRYVFRRAEVELNTIGRGDAKKLTTTNVSGLPIVENEYKEVASNATEFKVLEYLRKGIEEEIIMYKQAINVNPDDADLHFKLGILYLLLENKRSAVEEYKILKDLFPSMADGIMRKWNIKTPFSHKNRTVKIRRSFTNILGIAHYNVDRMGQKGAALDGKKIF